MWKKYCAYILATSAFLISHYILKSFMSTRRKKINNVLFFPDEYYQRQMNGEFSDAESPLRVLLKYMDEAKRSLDICVYLITSNILGDEVVICHEKGVKVRIITDANNTGETSVIPGAQITKFRANGIPVRCNHSSFWMHHKFMIVDNEVLVNGSFNWTNQAITGNNENLQITNKKYFVQPFIKEFEMLWEKFDPKTKLYT